MVEEITEQVSSEPGSSALLQEELAEADRGLMALALELEQRLDQRTAELHAANAKLEETSSTLIQLTRELEDRVALRTAALDAVNKELEAFSYSVSHDLHAPLRHIRGFIELLQNTVGPQLDGRSRQCLGQISDSAKRMSQLIDDLLAFARMARIELEQAPVDLVCLVAETIRQLEPETQSRRVCWKYGHLPPVVADLSLLRLVLLNLLSNAVKYTRPREQAEIEIGCAQETGEEVIIFIRDNGVGFDMKYVDKLFGVFQRLHPQEEFEGIGIGLANVRRIIARHGGRTWAESVNHQGATFYFSLPKPKPCRESA